MNTRRSKQGYCSICMKNTPHVRQFQSRILWLLDTLTFRLVRKFRIGPWYCMQCDKFRKVLRPVRSSAGEYSPDEHDASPTSASGELVGNYIKTDQSLVIRRNRASRYSQKYRDGVVQRILKGSTISQLGNELNLSENDLIDWIADMLARKQEKIEELTRIINAFDPSRLGQPRIDYRNPPDAGLDDGIEIIDGTVESRS